MTNSLEHLNEKMVEHNSHRSAFQNRTPEDLANAIQEEAKELVAEIQTSMLTGVAFTVVGEIGDLYILLAQLCSELGIDPAQAFEMKQFRNERKYGDWTMNNGYQPSEATALSKRAWAHAGGDEAFSHLYLDILADDSDL